MLGSTFRQATNNWCIHHANFVASTSMGVDYEVIPEKYHAFVTGILMLGLSWIERKFLSRDLTALN